MVTLADFDKSKLNIANVNEHLVDNDIIPEGDVYYGESIFCFTLTNVKTYEVQPSVWVPYGYVWIRRISHFCARLMSKCLSSYLNTRTHF